MEPRLLDGGVELLELTRTMRVLGHSPLSKRAARHAWPSRRAREGSQSTTVGGSPDSAVHAFIASRISDLE